MISNGWKRIRWSSGDWWKGLRWWSGEGFDEQEEDEGWTPMGTRFPPAPSLDRGLWLADKTIDIDKLPRQEPVLFSMPNKDPDLAKQRKHEWYVKNKEEILKRKRERRAAKKKQQPPQPKPPPSPEQIARTKELNRQACHRYRATHLAQVRLINRVYYHKTGTELCSNSGTGEQPRNVRSRNWEPWLTCAPSGWGGWTMNPPTKKKKNVEHQRQYI